MNEYITRLKSNLLEQGYNENYINLCTQYSQRLLDNNLPIIFDKEHLALLLGVNTNYLTKLFMVPEKFYKLAKIPKKRAGEFRELCLPFENLKEIQRWILHNILYKVEVSSAAKGFKLNESIIENARPHVKKNCIINIDLKDFFPNIKFKRIFQIFNYFGYTKEVSFILARLCTYKNRLPQGAPTSPYLSNIICKKLDKRLLKFALKNNLNYTRYADDITFSGDVNLENYVEFLCKIINEEKFLVNSDKLKIRHNTQRQMVTGIIVNEKLSIPREMKKFLRQQIYYCKSYGVHEHMEWNNIDRSNYKDYLYGLAYFVKMVEEEVGLNFLKELDEIHWQY